MYHISNDKRAQKSAQLIGNGMLNCLEHKEFGEITIAEIQRASTVSRATFYRLFDNTADVISYLCDGVFEQAEQIYHQKDLHTVEETTLVFIQVWMENKKLLQAVIDSNRMDFIFQSHMKYLAPRKEDFLQSSELDEPQLNYLMTTLTACTAAFLTAWLKNGAKESAQQLRQHIKTCYTTLGKIFE